MTAKEYLRQAYLLDQRINSHIKEKEEIRDMACSISSPKLGDKVQTSQEGEAPFTRSVYKLLELEQLINEEIDLLVDLKKQIHDVLEQVENPDSQMILRYRYVHNLTWEQIGMKLKIDRATAIRWHDSAMAKVILPEKPIEI